MKRVIVLGVLVASLFGVSWDDAVANRWYAHPLDVCHNIPGVQKEVPDGYWLFPPHYCIPL